eukprot:258196_1
MSQSIWPITIDDIKFDQPYINDRKCSINNKNFINIIEDNPKLWCHLIKNKNSLTHELLTYMMNIASKFEPEIPNGTLARIKVPGFIYVTGRAVLSPQQPPSIAPVLPSSKAPTPATDVIFSATPDANATATPEPIAAETPDPNIYGVNDALLIPSKPSKHLSNDIYGAIDINKFNKIFNKNTTITISKYI